MLKNSGLGKFVVLMVVRREGGGGGIKGERGLDSRFEGERGGVEVAECKID